VRAERCSQRGPRQKAHPAGTQQVAEAHHVQSRWHGPVRQHEVQPVGGELAQQLGETPVTAKEPRRWRHGERWREHSVGQRLDHHIGHADAQRQGCAQRPVAQGGLELVGGTKHPVGMVEHQPAGFGEFERSPRTAQQRLADGLFEQADLAADRLRRDVQAFAGTRHTAMFGHGPEVLQVLDVQVHRRLRLPRNRTIAPDYSTVYPINGCLASLLS
jgi:hypothetical protein